MHRVASNAAMTGHTLAKTASEHNLAQFVSSSQLPDDHFWYKHQAKRAEEFEKSRKAKRLQELAASTPSAALVQQQSEDTHADD